ncbi:MAG: hypothetical protein RLZZ450_3477 [Pseudomonadota bacterium]
MKRTLGPLLFAASLLLGAAPSVTSAQDAVRPAKTARARRPAPKTKKKKVRKAGRGSANETEGTAIAKDDTESANAPSPVPRDKRGKTRGRAETHAAEVTAKGASGSTAAVAAAQQSAAGVNAQIVKEGDTSVKVMEFSGLGIEGRLKSPQLVYFTQRVRAEFERPQLPHRSFMPELEASTAREPVR